MALTITEGTMFSEQPLFCKVVNVAFDNSYAAGGEDLDDTDYAPAGSTFLGAICEADGTYHFVYDEAAKKLMAITTADGIQVVGTTDLSGLAAIRVVFMYA